MASPFPSPLPALLMKMKFRVPHAFARASAFAFLAVGLVSCSVSKHTFDALDETQLVGEDPVFESLDLTRPLPDESLQPDLSPYRVGPGDILAIEVAEDARTQALSTVMPDGMLYYDVAGGIRANGKTLGEISDVLATKLEKDYPSPVVTVNAAGTVNRTAPASTSCLNISGNRRS